MSGNVNKAIIIGNLAQDPELKYLTSGIAICKFAVATNFFKKNKESEVEWHQIVAWGELAEICNEWLSKGSEVYIEGRIKTERWKKDEEWRYSTSIIAKKVNFL